MSDPHDKMISVYPSEASRPSNLSLPALSLRAAKVRSGFRAPERLAEPPDVALVRPWAVELDELPAAEDLALGEPRAHVPAVAASCEGFPQEAVHSPAAIAEVLPAVMAVAEECCTQGGCFPAATAKALPAVRAVAAERCTQGDCSRAACQDIAAAVAHRSVPAEWPTVDVEHSDCSAIHSDVRTQDCSSGQRFRVRQDAGLHHDFQARSVERPAQPDVKFDRDSRVHLVAE
jgi:hypothetical protein